MKGDRKVNIILFSFSLLLGFMVITQFNQHVESYNFVTLRTIQVTKNEISNISNEMEDLKLIIRKKQEEVKRINNKDDSSNAYDILNEELTKTKAAACLTDMEGPGIIINMQDNQDSEIVGDDIEDDVIHDSDILEILNDLRVAGAEAISINGQRIIPKSEIKCGGPIIKINGKSLATPFVIKAIGNPKILYAAINASGTYGYILKNLYKISVETSIEDSIKIPAYSGSFNFRYAKPIKEGD